MCHPDRQLIRIVGRQLLLVILHREMLLSRKYEASAKPLLQRRREAPDRYELREDKPFSSLLVACGRITSL
jgi:hypothetical protein